MKAPLPARRIALFACMLGLIALLPTILHADPSDPFDPANKAPVLSPTTKILMDHISFDAKVVPAKAKRGEVVKVIISGKILKKGFFTYPINEKTPQQDAPITQIKYSGVDGVKPLWPIEANPQPELVRSLGKIVLHHEEPFTWSQDLLIEPDAKAGQYQLTITLDDVMVCREGACLPLASYRPLYVDLEIEAGEALAPAKNLQTRSQGPPPVKVRTPTESDIASLNKNPGNTTITPTVETPNRAEHLWSFLGFAALSAFFMLLTPCVFPMIPITVNFFIKQSEKEHHNPLLMASVYAGTIIVMLTTIMLVLGSFIIKVANNEWFNIALGAVLIIFALSLFGMYEIELPHFLARYTSAREGHGGLIGAVFMAMTFTITSFTCTGPFLGLMLGSVAGTQPPMLNLVLGALVYSTTFAAPFFLLALFPSVLKKLPKSGSWLNSVKVTMGFLELGAALKFLSNADLAFFPGNPQLFNYDTVLAAWIALSVLCSIYLLGLFRLPHDDKVESIGVLRMLFAGGFLTLAVYLAPAMLGQKPAGLVGDNVVAFLPIRTGHENDAVGPGRSGGQSQKDFYLDYDDAWKDAIENNKLIFIDFTGTNCSNCRYNEQSVFILEPVKQELSKLTKVSLYTDSVPNQKLSAAQSKEQGARNMQWQEALAGKDLTLPTYILLRPARDAALENGVPKGTIVGKTEGAIFDVPGFVRVLQNAQGKATAQLNLPKK